MTVILDTDPHFKEEPKVTNLVFVVALNLVCVAGIAAGAHAAGLNWGWSLMVGASGGGAATLASLAVIVALLPVASKWQPETAPNRQTATQSRSEILALWDADAGSYSTKVTDTAANRNTRKAA